MSATTVTGNNPSNQAWANLTFERCWETLKSAPSALTAPIGQIYQKLTTFLGYPSHPPSRLDTLPDELKVRFSTHLNPSDLSNLSAIGGDWGNLVQDNEIWKTVADRISCPIMEGSPVAEQVVRFIVDIQKKAANIFHQPDDIAQILRRPSLSPEQQIWNYIKDLPKQIISGGPNAISQIANSPAINQINHLREWIQARDTIIVWDALAKQIPGIDLSHIGLTNLNTSQAVIDKAKEFAGWFQANENALVQLTTLLDLQNRQLSSLPSQIGALTQLHWLCLTNNQFSSFPKEILRLTQLRNLYFRDNQLTSVPAEIGNLTQLTVLAFSGNLLTSLPSQMDLLNQLTHLDLTGNQLQLGGKVYSFIKNNKAMIAGAAILTNKVVQWGSPMLLGRLINATGHDWPAIACYLLFISSMLSLLNALAPTTNRGVMDYRKDLEKQTFNSYIAIPSLVLLLFIVAAADPNK